MGPNLWSIGGVGEVQITGEIAVQTPPHRTDIANQQVSELTNPGTGVRRGSGIGLADSIMQNFTDLQTRSFH